MVNFITELKILIEAISDLLINHQIPYNNSLNLLEISGGEVIIRGGAWKFGNDVDTDAIIAARYLNTSDPEELAKHLMEDIDRDFRNKIKKGDIIVAGKNFGCGSSREHAPIAIKAAGIHAVIAKSFARIFYRNAFNIGLPIFESADASERVRQNDDIEINADEGIIRNLTTKEEYKANPIPPFMQDLIAEGGLVEWTKKKLRAVNRS
jgi:3-isopropylmalate/(R)-2-methylmalate dehydratase small subunit